MQFIYTELHLFFSSTTEQKDIRYDKTLKRIKILNQAGDYCLSLFNAGIVYYEQFSEGYCSCIIGCMNM